MDTGSTHNFISTNWVKELGLKYCSIHTFPVMVAFDKELFVSKSCPLVQSRFHDHVYKADILVLPSNTFGVILVCNGSKHWVKLDGIELWSVNYEI